MHPALSVILFTTASGAGYGLLFLVGLLTGTSFLPESRWFAVAAFALSLGAVSFGLLASTFHLGRPERAWRAVLMWRTSWLSREVIVLPAFIGVVGLWGLALRAGVTTPLLPLASIVVAALLWYCTAMIYACLRFIQEWAQPLTPVNFALIGLSSGLVLASALAAFAGESELLRISGPCALLVTLLAWATRVLALRRNAALKHKSTLQSATGIRAPNLVQTSMGMSAGAFNTREFFHGRTLALLKQVRLGFLLLGFALPALFALWGVASGTALPWALALACQVPGLLAERWFFFAQARHPQNLYYQVVS
jgi:sulfite dehydrogenase (quinone) subunit SoeC